MFIKKTHILFFFILFTNISFSQQPQLDWSARYNSPVNGDDRAKDMAMDSAGNIYVTGMDAFTPGVVTIKYNNSGQQLWLKRFTNGLSIVSIGYKIKSDNRGNVFVMGDDSHGFLIKYDSAGNQKWVSQFAEFNTTFSDLAVSKSGFIYISGGTRRSNIYGDILIAKYNQSGDTVWMRTYNIPNNKGAGANSIYLDDSNYVYITGTVTMKTSIDTTDAFCTVKYDSLGTFKWMKYYKNSFPNKAGQAYKINGDKRGNVYITGLMYDSTSIYYHHFCTLKYLNDGTLKWVNYYRGVIYGGGTPKDMAVDSIGNVYITGESPDSGSIFYSYATIKYDTEGNQRWVRRYFGQGIDLNIPASIFLDKSSNCYVTGSFLTLKYDSSGYQKWILTNPDPQSPYSYRGVKIIVDKNNNIFIASDGDRDSSGFDFLILKYNQLTNIITSGIKSIKDYELFQNYPNPFNPFTSIRYKVESTKKIKLVVFDILGKEIAVLVNEKQKAGEYEVSFNGANLPSGVYYYVLYAEGVRVEERMMALIK
jgi:hypothetical protein